MKVAVIKLGARISFNAKDTSGGNGEARTIIKMLKLGGADVHIFTKILAKDNLIEDYTWHNLSSDIDTSGMDALVVLNGAVNFFGGAEDKEQLLNYVIINSFGGPVFYTLCDPALTLKQVWPSVEKKDWGSKWAQEQLEITRSDIVYLSQPFDTEKVASKLGKNEVIPKAIVHYPFEKFPCLNEMLPINPTPSVDLSYGGTMRGGRRAKKMAKFYFDVPGNINVEMFGKISAEDFPEKVIAGLFRPEFTGPVQYNDMLKKMNQSLAHCVIGDPWYEEINDIPQRLYESVWSNVITFVDTDLDSVRRVWANDKELGDFLYVSSCEELAEKISFINEDESLRLDLLARQVKAVNFDAKEYCESFVKLLVNQIEL